MPDLVQININLLVRKDSNKVRPVYWGIGFILLAIIGGLTGFGYISLSKELSQQQMVNAELQSKINRYNDEIAGLKPIREMERELVRKSQEVVEIEKGLVSYSDLIAAIDKAEPPKVLVVGLDIKAPKTVVNGFSPDHSHIARMIEGLQNSFGYENLTLLTSIINEEIDESKFALELDLAVEKK